MLNKCEQEYMNNMNNTSIRQSQLVSKTRRSAAQEEVSVNAALLMKAGFVDKLMAGVYSYLPLGQRVLWRIEQIIREEMSAIGSQEILMPGLQPKEFWEKTARWDSMDVLFKLKGAGDRDLALGPTHEEIVTPLVGAFIQSYKDLPRSVFQIQTKFRNEVRAKSGVLRGREFRMKDMYSFHATLEDLDAYYEKAQEAYTKIFKRCGLGDLTYLTYASGGDFCQYSHEYQTVTPHGEDQIYFWRDKNVAVNHEIIEDVKLLPEWEKAEFEVLKSIEVGNIFKLGSRFSDAFGLFYQDKNGARMPIYMGCYGIGSTRLMGSIAEIHHDDRGLIWPAEVAPFDFHLVDLTPKGNEMADKLYEELTRQGKSVLYDDREASAGEKFADSDLLGIPVRGVISKKTLSEENPSIEIKHRFSNEVKIVTIQQMLGDLK